MNMRKTKIICTLGPAVDHAETIERLIRTGMNAARFNFSHGSHAEQLARLNMFKKVRDTLGAPVATILDTKGPEIRIKTFADGPVTLEQGQGFILTTDDVPGDGRRVSVTYANLHKEVGPGCRILVDDGLIELRVQKVEGHEIHCEVENGGPLSSNKSINIPDVHILLPSLTDKDREESEVRRGQRLRLHRRLLRAQGQRRGGHPRRTAQARRRQYPHHRQDREPGGR